MTPKKPILVLSTLALALTNLALPAQALVGRLSGHSIGMVRRWQQASKTKSDHSTPHTSKHRQASSLRRTHKTHAKAIAIGLTSPSYFWTAPISAQKLPEEAKESISQSFWSGNSGQYSVGSLVGADVVASCPLHGGVFNRREPVQYIILHSTETARIADAQRVIASWNNRGLRHPGAQFVVDRDGVIYCTADPTYGTSHVDRHKSLKGVNNDNSVGIEMVRTGDQQYTQEQMRSIACLVHYLQARFSVADNHIYGHGQIQPSDRTDPVNFNWQAFAVSKDNLSRNLNRTAYAR